MTGGVQVQSSQQLRFKDQQIHRVAPEFKYEPQVLEGFQQKENQDCQSHSSQNFHIDENNNSIAFGTFQYVDNPFRQQQWNMQQQFIQQQQQQQFQNQMMNSQYNMGWNNGYQNQFRQQRQYQPPNRLMFQPQPDMFFQQQQQQQQNDNMTTYSPIPVTICPIKKQGPKKA